MPSPAPQHRQRGDDLYEPALVCSARTRSRSPRRLTPPPLAAQLGKEEKQELKWLAKYRCTLDILYAQVESDFEFWQLEHRVRHLIQFGKRFEIHSCLIPAELSSCMHMLTGRFTFSVRRPGARTVSSLKLILYGETPRTLKIAIDQLIPPSVKELTNEAVDVLSQLF